MKYEIKNYIKDYRKIFDITQDELAERLSVSRQSIISIENDRYMPSLILAYKMAEVFNCSINDLYMIKGNAKGSYYYG